MDAKKKKAYFNNSYITITDSAAVSLTEFAQISAAVSG